MPKGSLADNAIGPRQSPGFRSARAVVLALVVICLLPRAAEAGDWRRSLTPPIPGSFPEIESFRAKFGFGWANILEAAEATAELRAGPDTMRIDVVGGTRGIVRGMWRLDAMHLSVIDRKSLRPSHLYQNEKYANREIETNVKFSAGEIWRFRKVSPHAGNWPKWKRIAVADAFDILGGILWVRSLPLRDGDRARLVVFPGDSPYLADARVVRREQIMIAGRKTNAIRIDLGLQRIETKGPNKGKLRSHGKFRNGRVWVSDDAARLPVRAEVNVFVGYIYVELKEFAALE